MNHAINDPSIIQVVNHSITALKIRDDNPRLHSKTQIKQIAKSIEAFGFTSPVLIDKDKTIIAGHGRIEACRLLGWQQVPTISLDYLTAEQVRAYMIADNRLTENSEWDERLLGVHFKELAAIDLDFDLDVTGFSLAEIDIYIDGLDMQAVEQDEADAVPEPDSASISKPGDIWLLGCHKIICANALESENYQKLMGSERADLVFTDPPYNVKIQGHVSGKGAIQHREFAMASGELSADEFRDFLDKSLKNCSEYSAEGSIHFICMDWRHTGEIMYAGARHYSEQKNLCVWAKDNAGMGSLYRSQHELIFVYKKGTASHKNNIELGKHGRHRSNVWQYPGINTLRKQSEEGDLLALHPTVKPVALVCDAIKDCSHRGDLILDPFLGSGTTLIAAERIGRRCHAIELDPLYVDTAIKRWQDYTGENAYHSETGQSFNTLLESVSS